MLALFGDNNHNLFTIIMKIFFVQEQGRSKKYQRMSMFVFTNTKEDTALRLLLRQDHLPIFQSLKYDEAEYHLRHECYELVCHC